MMYVKTAVIFLSTNLLLACLARSAEKISLPLIPNLTRADVYVEPYPGDARATLILCPGLNGNGQDLVESEAWSDFAKEYKLNLLGISFASAPGTKDEGYFKASHGSGVLLLDGIQQAFGPNRKPLLLYGFSRGAQFVYSFVTWKPDNVAAWCAYSATEWESPEPNVAGPKGIVACGDEDQSNYSFATLQFLKGRSIHLPWTWVSLNHQGHAWSGTLDNFVRVYFAAILASDGGAGIWLDVDTKEPLNQAEIDENPTLAVWLPDAGTAKVWKEVHQP